MSPGTSLLFTFSYVTQEPLEASLSTLLFILFSNARCILHQYAGWLPLSMRFVIILISYKILYNRLSVIRVWQNYYLPLLTTIDRCLIIPKISIKDTLPFRVCCRSNCCILNTGNSCAAIAGEPCPLNRAIGTTSRTDIETGKLLNNSKKSDAFSNIFLVKIRWIGQESREILWMNNSHVNPAWTLPKHADWHEIRQVCSFTFPHW